jgi:hypothetical protein
MKADESADRASRWIGRLSTGLCFYFFLGPRNRKMHLKKQGFRLGPDLAILSSSVYKTVRVLVFQFRCLFTLLLVAKGQGLGGDKNHAKMAAIAIVAGMNAATISCM